MADGHSVGLTLVPLRGKPRHAARTGTESPSKREGSRSEVRFGSLSLWPAGVPRVAPSSGRDVLTKAKVGSSSPSAPTDDRQVGTPMTLSDERGSGYVWPPAYRSRERSPTRRATATARTADATPEQHRYLMDLQLVQHTGLERALRGVRAMHRHVPVPGGGLGLCHRAGFPVGHVRHQRIVRNGRAGGR